MQIPVKMTEVGIVNLEKEDKYLENNGGIVNIKNEEAVTIKREPVECGLCLERSVDHTDINTKTNAGTSLHVYLSKYTSVDLTSSETVSKAICKNCYELINILEQTESEYLKLKENFESIISKNPLFVVQVTNVEFVKNESSEKAHNNVNNSDSEDEPLSLTKRKRNQKCVSRKNYVAETNKRKTKQKINKDSWNCKECNERGEKGGQQALISHMLLNHIQLAPIHVDVIKKEDEKTESPEHSTFEDVFKVEIEGFDDDDYIPEEDIEDSKCKTKQRGRKKGPLTGRKRQPKDQCYACDKCDAKYTSMVRLAHHKQKHEDDSKPPYICEVCGAHYKHKRACDIHVALHKGISDWKCEECNKLFPSKGALQRHNNIHTGKLNYQCDLCGKSFIHTSSFKMHKLSHSGVKPHSCDVCGLALMTRSHLKRHKRVHSGEKRHECAVCGKRFSERYNLLAHSKSHAGGAAGAGAGAGGAGPGAGAGAGDAPERRRMFRCTFCQERFERRYMLERHVSCAHGRSLERPPPTPRNTMSKLLKAQAQRRAAHAAHSAHAAHAAHARDNSDTKDSRSPETRTSPVTVQKLVSHISTSTDPINAWTNVYTAEFALRQEYSQ
ncbi:zinc finger protein Xfin-like [Zerene cesonia]|uniref:zinc finger protein Xfin-like n=1 Tax=Zerene cesonia TaxID=33412 RepID=UPI0018E4F776|nr:zinc finger protein Xfin-like [Zerene cesonia]